MKAAVRSRTQLRNSFIHSVAKLQGRKKLSRQRNDRVSPARDATAIDPFMIVARSERLVDGRMGKVKWSRRILDG